MQSPVIVEGKFNRSHDGCQEQIHALDNKRFVHTQDMFNQLHNTSDVYFRSLSRKTVHMEGRNMNYLACMNEAGVWTGSHSVQEGECEKHNDPLSTLEGSLLVTSDSKNKTQYVDSCF